MDQHELLRHAGVTAATVAASALVAVGVVFGGTAVHQAEHPPTCYGIGWGCTPDAATTALLVGVMVVLPAVLVVGITLGVGMLVARSRPAARPWVRRWSLLLRALAGAVALAAVVSLLVLLVG